MQMSKNVNNDVSKDSPILIVKLCNSTRNVGLKLAIPDLTFHWNCSNEHILQLEGITCIFL